MCVCVCMCICVYVCVYVCEMRTVRLPSVCVCVWSHVTSWKYGVRG